VNWSIGSTRRITWNHNLGAGSRVVIEVSRNGGAAWTAIAGGISNADDASGFYDWTVTGPATAAARVRVRWANGPAIDMSNADFTIAAPFLTLTAPNGAGANWGAGTQRAVMWTSNASATEKVRIRLSTDGGATFPVTLAPGTANDGLQFVNVPNTPSAAARVRVELADNAAVGDVSDASFVIGAPFVRVTSPNGGEKWTPGSTRTVRWVSNLGAQERVSIELSTDGGASWRAVAPSAAAAAEAESVLVASTPSDGTQAVVLPAVNSAAARLRIIWLDNPAVRDVSDGNFIIGPP
jgi:hypothetical protein